MTWAELYAQLGIPKEQQLHQGTGALPAATAAPAYSLASLFPQYAAPQGQAAPAMATTAFGGAIPADQQAASAASWRDFFETVRRYNQDYDLAKMQDARNFGENVRQFQAQFDEANWRYRNEWPYLQKRDAWSIAGAAFLPNARFLTR